MNVKATLILFLFVIQFSNQLFMLSIPERWGIMQSKYNTLNSFLLENGYLTLENTYCHPHWKENKEKIKALIHGSPKQNFFSHPSIDANMVRKGWTMSQRYEVCFLQNCISPKTKEKIAQAKDSDFGSLPKECKEFNCSTSTLGHLYYAAKSLEQFANNDPQTIVEFGSGYGNLARLFKLINLNTTIILIDLPELLALQFLFLSSTLPENTNIIVHNKLPETFETGAIHLLPVFFLENLNLKTDLFISTFALTEAPETVQKLIAQKKFFNADICYIVGQLEGCTINWVSHSLLHDFIRKDYSTVYCEPSYLYMLNVPAYEIIGIN